MKNQLFGSRRHTEPNSLQFLNSSVCVCSVFPQELHNHYTFWLQKMNHFLHRTYGIYIPTDNNRLRFPLLFQHECHTYYIKVTNCLNTNITQSLLFYKVCTILLYNLTITDSYVLTNNF